MRVVAVSRIKDEADIIEPFVRHTAAFVDHHVLLDNGSADATIDILTRLRAAGRNLSLYRNATSIFVEEPFNTFLYREAAAAHGAQWVLFLDADEFIAWRGAPADFRAWLAAQPNDVAVLEVGLANYVPRSSDPQDEPNVVRRITHRMEPMPWVGKIFARATADPDRIAALRVLPGNHAIADAAGMLPAERVEDVRLAHFPHRTGAQLALKSILGRVRVLSTSAAPEWQGFNNHYNEPLHKFLSDPCGYLVATAHADHVPAVPDPLAYAGEALVFTAPVDPLARLLAGVTLAALRSAAVNGGHLDRVPQLRDRFLRDAATAERVF